MRALKNSAAFSSRCFLLCAPYPYCPGPHCMGKGIKTTFQYPGVREHELRFQSSQGLRQIMSCRALSSKRDSRTVPSSPLVTLQPASWLPTTQVLCTPPGAAGSPKAYKHRGWARFNGGILNFLIYEYSLFLLTVLLY
jgi:hypothetical protein